MYLRICWWYFWRLFSQRIWIIRILIVPLGTILIWIVDKPRGGTRGGSTAVDHGQVARLPAGRRLHGSPLGPHRASSGGSHLKCGKAVLKVSIVDDLLFGLFWKENMLYFMMTWIEQFHDIIKFPTLYLNESVLLLLLEDGIRIILFLKTFWSFLNLFEIALCQGHRIHSCMAFKKISRVSGRRSLSNYHLNALKIGKANWKPYVL